MTTKTLGSELISAVKEALQNKDQCEIVRPKVNIASVRKQSQVTQKKLSKS